MAAAAAGGTAATVATRTEGRLAGGPRRWALVSPLRSRTQYRALHGLTRCEACFCFPRPRRWAPVSLGTRRFLFEPGGSPWLRRDSAKSGWCDPPPPAHTERSRGPGGEVCQRLEPVSCAGASVWSFSLVSNTDEVSLMSLILDQAGRRLGITDLYCLSVSLIYVCTVSARFGQSGRRCDTWSF